MGDLILTGLLVGLWIWAVILISTAPPYQPEDDDDCPF